jgi:hypothetical protein
MRIILIGLIAIFLVACQPFEYEADVSYLDETNENLTENNAVENLGMNQTDINVTDESRAAYKITVTEGELARIPIRAIDPDGGEIELEFSEPFNQQGLWLTSIGDEGRYLVEISAYDGFVTTKEYVLVEVLRSNRAPIIDCPLTVTVQESENLSLDCNIYDLEGDNFTVTYEGWMNTSTKQTDFGDAGNHRVLIRATDNQGNSATNEVRIAVNKTNRAPVIENIENMQVLETQTVQLEVEAYDPDGDNLTITYSSPFNENGTYTPDFEDRGIYNISVRASDSDLQTTQTFELEVLARNRPPVLEPVNPITVNEGETVTIPVVANDPDGDDVIISYSGWMDSNEYQTTYEDAYPLGCEDRGCEAAYFVTVIASDGNLESSTLVEVNVVDQNRPPRFIFGEE